MMANVNYQRHGCSDSLLAGVCGFQCELDQKLQEVHNTYRKGKLDFVLVKSQHHRGEKMS